MANKFFYSEVAVRITLFIYFITINFFALPALVIADNDGFRLSPEREKQERELTEKSAKKYIELKNKWVAMIDRQTNEASILAGFSPTLISSPLGYWTLMRKDDVTCALRFISLHNKQTNFDHPPSVSTYSFFANYEWIAQEDGSGDFSKANIESGKGEASKKPNVWRFERGTQSVKCGSLKAQWWYPNFVYLINRNYKIPDDPIKSDQSNGIEIALTGWKNIEDVDAHDTRLVWYRYNRDAALLADKDRLKYAYINGALSAVQTKPTMTSMQELHDPDGDYIHYRDELTMIPVEELPGFEKQ